MSIDLRREILKQLRSLRGDQQRQVLNFVQRIARTEPTGVQGRELLRFSGFIRTQELQAISSVIAEECEGIDLNAC